MDIAKQSLKFVDLKQNRFIFSMSFLNQLVMDIKNKIVVIFG